MQKKLVLIILVVVLALTSVFLVHSNIRLKNSIREFSEKKDAEFKELLTKERERIRRDLEELHRADMVSYDAMGKRLMIERDRTKKLQEELEALKKKLGK